MISVLKKINMPILLLILVSFVYFFGTYVPLDAKNFFYTLSMLIKSGLIFLLPFIIFSCIFSTVISFESKALKLLSFMIFAIILSDFLAVIYSYSMGRLFLPSIMTETSLIDTTVTSRIAPYFDWNPPTLIKNEISFLLGISLGVFFQFKPMKLATKIGKTLKTSVDLFLEKCFLPLLPFFVLGFLLKLQDDRLIETLVSSYGSIVLFILAVKVLYIFVWFLILCKGSFKELGRVLQNVMSPALVGFSTLSSLAALPFSIKAATKNTHGSSLPQMVIPSTVNNHVMGDNMTGPLLCLSVMFMFHYPLLSNFQLVELALLFVIASFSMASVPGGATIAIFPIVKDFLKFEDEMVSVLLTMYLIFDVSITVFNILGNQAFAIAINSLFSKKKKIAEKK